MYTVSFRTWRAFSRSRVNLVRRAGRHRSRAALAIKDDRPARGEAGPRKVVRKVPPTRRSCLSCNSSFASRARSSWTFAKGTARARHRARTRADVANIFSLRSAHFCATVVVSKVKIFISGRLCKPRSLILMEFSLIFCRYCRSSSLARDKTPKFAQNCVDVRSSQANLIFISIFMHPN